MPVIPANPQLIVLSGLPGVGKTTIARKLAREIGAVYLRVDTIEQSLRRSEIPLEGPEGYLVAYAAARDNLALGSSVIADSVNPIELTRAAWEAVAEEADAEFVPIELVCSDEDEHRRRVESRSSDIDGLELPDWQAVQDREFEPWLEAQRFDTVEPSEKIVRRILKRLG